MNWSVFIRYLVYATVETPATNLLPRPDHDETPTTKVLPQDASSKGGIEYTKHERKPSHLHSLNMTCSILHQQHSGIQVLQTTVKVLCG